MPLRLRLLPCVLQVPRRATFQHLTTSKGIKNIHRNRISALVRKVTLNTHPKLFGGLANINRLAIIIIECVDSELGITNSAAFRVDGV